MIEKPDNGKAADQSVVYLKTVRMMDVGLSASPGVFLGREGFWILKRKFLRDIQQNHENLSCLKTGAVQHRVKGTVSVD